MSAHVIVAAAGRSELPLTAHPINMRWVSAMRHLHSSIALAPRVEAGHPLLVSAVRNHVRH
jgi:hypothetical protein